MAKRFAGALAKAAKRVRKNARKVKKFKRARTVKWNSITTLGMGFPKKLVVTHKYAANMTFNITTGILTTQNFRANGMFDPDQTGTGHQPIYFDQMTALYDHYCVIGSKIDITVTHGAATNGPVFCALYVDDDTTPATSTQEAIEQNGAKGRVLPGGSPYNIRFTNKWSAKKYFGGAVLANTDLQGDASTDPTEQSHYVFQARPCDGTSTMTLFLQVKIQYIAVWKELKTIASS